ncbi:hypothetical protein EV198_0788 [Roseivirga ehrenbergii]|uniref:Uncharacterized protein n=1 Tax=Roseivirga ehrenbergii (strain DSM 102268 / JCM 13514 / KCTC 12282 / NCIMB 14502 / KMM 6017) TaxID=279360 RepID=A0A150X7M2_ROSEK|nr:hypothetical protein [Roseivirga ehrenbergii]KYG74721.1 hypothetical protein MB14_05820 [Roseivirga ehrenbergii]TCL13954.1 hypothetical protein EV198_0788 [Roseivirga ehrenbergii]
MAEDKNQEFVAKLIKLYGEFDYDLKRFKKASNSEISRKLGYSDAQFSRLINSSATEGEYVRAIQNTDRILKLLGLEKELNQLKDDQLAGQYPNYKRKVTILYALLLILGILSVYFAYQSTIQKTDNFFSKESRDGMLKWSFETPYVNPFMELDDLPSDCSYPSYKYQGKWELEKPYKIPFFRERNGFHYIATEVNMYARSMNEKNTSGNTLEAYEYQRHEIWYDKRELPIDSFMVASNQSQLKQSYQDSNFEDEDTFVKLAVIHTFFRNEFNLETDGISRSGKVVGRDVEFVSEDILKTEFTDEGLMRDALSQVNAIIANRLEDFSRPISCNLADFPKADFNLIAEGDKISFDCQMTTSRFSVDYNKTYVLKDQFIKNTCVPGT